MPISQLDSETERAARSFLRLVSDHYDCVGAIIFGSRARQNHRTDSDADLAVLLRGESTSFLATKLAMADLAYDVLLETGIRIQPLPIWQGEWNHPETYSNPQLLNNISNEGIRL